MRYCHHQYAVTSVNNWLTISRLIVSLLDFLRLCRRLPLVFLPDGMESQSFFYWRSVSSWSRMVLFSNLFRHVPIAEVWSCVHCVWFRCCCVGIGLRFACWSQEHSHLQWIKSWWGREKCSSGRFWLSRGRHEMQQPLQPALGKGLRFCWLPPANFVPSVLFTSSNKSDSSIGGGATRSYSANALSPVPFLDGFIHCSQDPHVQHSI